MRPMKRVMVYRSMLMAGTCARSARDREHQNRPNGYRDDRKSSRRRSDPQTLIALAEFGDGRFHRADPSVSKVVQRRSSRFREWSTRRPIRYPAVQKSGPRQKTGTPWGCQHHFGQDFGVGSGVLFEGSVSSMRIGQRSGVCSRIYGVPSPVSNQ
jgi:hypothetical protein